MADEKSTIVNETADNADSLRVYEVGYHIIPTVKEEDLESIVGGIRSVIEKAGGNFIAEGAPSLMRLAYGIEGREGGKRVEYDRAYFGWIKFETEVAAAKALEAALKQSSDVARFIIFRTVKEDTRAKFKAPTLREVKRTDTIRPTTRRTEEPAAPVSEEDLEKALHDITAE
jgi:ribosomal protein S6